MFEEIKREERGEVEKETEREKLITHSHGSKYMNIMRLMITKPWRASLKQ